MKAKLYKVENTFYLKVGETILGTSSNPNLSASIRYSLSLKNCQEIELGYDLDELADEFSRKFPNDSEPIRYASFIIGAKTILEILGDKKFSEKDVISMIEKSRETGLTAEYLILNNQQNEWGVEIVMEDSIGISDKYTPDTKPKLDQEGCLILKRIKE